MNSVWDELIAVIDRERTREADEQNAQHDAEYEAERTREKAAQNELLELAASTLRNFVELEDRRVRALELIAHSAATFAQQFSLARAAGELRCSRN